MLNNISIKAKLLSIFLVPVILLTALSSVEIYKAHKLAQDQSDLTELMDISIAASNLVHEMQKERGASAGYTNSNGKSYEAFKSTIP